MVERSLAWLVGYRRLQVRYERRADILTAFLQLACALMCLQQLNQPTATSPVGSWRWNGPGGWVAHRGLARQRLQLTASSTACCWDRPWSATRRCQV